MVAVIFSFAGALIVLALLAALGSRVVARVVTRVVRDRHQDAEYIHETGNIPASWRTNQTDTQNFRNLALRRLDKLCSYFQHSPVFENDDARQQLLDSLRRTRARWESEEISAFLPEI